MEALPWRTSPAFAARTRIAPTTASGDRQSDRLRPLRQDPHIRLLYCRTCKARFSERKGTPLFRSCLPEDKAIDLIGHLADRNGVRATARLVGVHRDTVVRYSRLVGEHARQLHDELVAFSPSDRRGPARREVVVRLQEAGALRPRRPGR